MNEISVPLLVTLATLGGFSVLIVQQILKLNIVPNGFANKFPVPTCIILSLAAAALALQIVGKLVVATWQDFAVTAITVLLVASITYNNVFRNWQQLRELEGEGK